MIHPSFGKPAVHLAGKGGRVKAHQLFGQELERVLSEMNVIAG